MFHIERHVMADRSLDRAIAQLIHDVFVGEGYTPAARAPAFDAAVLRGRGALWIATRDGAVIGTAFLVEQTSPFRQAAAPGEGELHLLAVSPAARATGVGRALVETVIAEAALRGMQRLVLSSQPAQRAAHALYARCGFRRAPARDWSAPDGRPYWVFERALADGGAP